MKARGASQVKITTQTAQHLLKQLQKNPFYRTQEEFRAYLKSHGVKDRDLVMSVLAGQEAREVVRIEIFYRAGGDKLIDQLLPKVQKNIQTLRRQKYLKQKEGRNPKDLKKWIRDKLQILIDQKIDIEHDRAGLGNAYPSEETASKVTNDIKNLTPEELYKELIAIFEA